MDEILQRLIDEGGCLVPSGQCSQMEIAIAGACRRFFIRDGYGFVLKKTPEQIAEALEKITFSKQGAKDDQETTRRKTHRRRSAKIDTNGFDPSLQSDG